VPRSLKRLGLVLGLSGLLALLFVAVTVGIAIPALPGGLGTFEAGAVLALAASGIGLDAAVSYAVVLRLGIFALPTILAFVIMARENLGLDQLRREVTEALARRKTS